MAWQPYRHTNATHVLINVIRGFHTSMSTPAWKQCKFKIQVQIHNQKLTHTQTWHAKTKWLGRHIRQHANNKWLGSHANTLILDIGSEQPVFLPVIALTKNHNCLNPGVGLAATELLDFLYAGWLASHTLFLAWQVHNVLLLFLLCWNIKHHWRHSIGTESNLCWIWMARQPLLPSQCLNILQWLFEFANT